MGEFESFSYVGVPYFPSYGKDRLAAAEMPVTCPQAKKEPALSSRFFYVGVTYFSGQSPGKYRRRR